VPNLQQFQEIIIVAMNSGKYTLIPVTVEDGEPLNYRERQWGKGDQTRVDEEDFPTLAKRGLHSEIELDQTKTITGRSTSEITEDGRPGASSGAGFMHKDEDIISVLKGDNQLVRKLGLTHPEAAKPLFHMWNLFLNDGHGYMEKIDYILYNDKKVHLKATGGRGWQESLFNDEILGSYHIEVRRELDAVEIEYLKDRYSDDPLSELVGGCVSRALEGKRSWNPHCNVPPSGGDRLGDGERGYHRLHSGRG
jgi:hypothetical protein